MSKLANIELFRVYAGATFALLYESFPLKSRLDASQIIDHCSLADDAISHARHLQLVEQTWRWLVETDYLRYDEQTSTYDLTPRSFEGLTFLDDANEGVCRGEALLQLTANVASKSFSNAISEVVVRIMGSGARTFITALT